VCSVEKEVKVQRYSSKCKLPCRHRGGIDVKLYSFLTSAVDGVGAQSHAPNSLPVGEIRFPLISG
jgi:hypothetical protein